MNPKTGQKKWVITILVAAVLIAAAVAVAIFAGSGPDAPVVETPVDGPETGVYYYDTAEGEYVLTLNSGNRFTIAGPSLNKSGKYVVTENGIELDFVKDEDGTGAITVDGDVMNLQYKDKTMRFLKKVTYAVTFNANGGSEVASINVVNGKTVSKPADPSKEGNVFIGWYADEACTKLYPFGTEAVTANTTVYAKWAETVVGQNEYTVDFDLGYDAEGYAAMATIGGKLYNVPTPERDGYTFGGWWVSMTQKADALTVPYTEEMVFQANTTLFALWQTAPQGGKLEAPMVEVYADSIKWNTVKGASSYELKILNAKGEVVYTEQLGTTTKNYNFNELTAGEYTVEVTALASVEEKNSETTTRTFVNKALDRVSLFTVVDGGILLWNGVEGAEKYLITIDCGNENHKHTAFDNGSSTTFMFAGCDMQEGGIRFTVTAVAEGKASSVSETFVYDRKLDAVGQILYNEETQSFYWDSVSNAAKYLVTVTVGGETYTVDNGSATTFSVKNLSGDIQLAIVPATKGYNSPEAATTTYTKTSLATPEGLTVSGNILSWNAVEGATGYMVKINNQSFPADSNSLDLLGLAVEFDSSTTYNISVMALGTESSLYSDAVTIKYLAEIDNVSYKNNTLTWTPILGVENYEIRVNGGEPITVSGTNSAKVVLTKAGMNLIEVRYSDLGGSKWASTEVFAYAVTYDSRSLNGIVTEYLAMGDTMMLPGEFTQDGYDFTGWYNSPDAASGMGGIYTEKQFAGSGSMVLYGNWTPKTYYVEFVGVEGVMNITKGDKQPVTFHDGYRLPIPENPNAGGEFAGWYTGPGASGTALTDSLGNCITEYQFARDTVAYPFFDTGVLSYVLQADNTYAVKAGPTISGVANVTVPEYYKGFPVTVILENAFYGITTIETLNIPATIKIIGAGAIPTAATLKEINVYENTVQQNYEVFFSSHEGALLRHDMGTIYLEVFPRGKTGEYTIPDNVDVVRDKVFRYSQISKLTVGKNVSLIMRNAFYGCSKLEVLEFKGEGEVLLTIDPEAFYRTANITTLCLPARLAETDLMILNQFTKLTTIEVEDGGVYYSAKENNIYNAAGDILLFAAMDLNGEYEIPMGVREIGPMAFANRFGLTKVMIPNYVNKIGEAAFQNCVGITEVVIEGSRRNDLLIDTKAFEGCENIVTITFQGNGTTTADTGVTTIGTSAFENIKQLQTVTFDSGVNVVIGERAFANNLKLVNPVYADGSCIQSIGKEAFAGCVRLSEALIPATLDTVGDGAFSGCEYILEVTFAPDGKEVTFGSDVFAGCKRLATVSLPATLGYFDGSVFSGCDTIKEIIVDENNQSFATYDGALYTKDYSEILYYPKDMDGDLSKLHADLKKIGNNVFQDNPKITNVTIGKNIVSIGNNAFRNCYNLTEVVFEEGAGAMTIGNYAFYKCSKLTAIELPVGTTSIGSSAFESAGLKSFVIPENVEFIGAKAFKATKITKINIPANVESIGDGAFAGCTSMTAVTFAPGTKPLTLGTLENTSTSNGVFYNTKIATVELGDRVTLLGAYAFYNQKNLKSFTMGENSQLTEIGQRAFYCSSGSKLATVTLGPKVETIHDYAFYGAKITGIIIPKSVTLVGQYAFSKSSLTSVDFAPGGTADLTIAQYAFAAAKLKTVNLPARLMNAYDMYKATGVNGEWKTFWNRFQNNANLEAINVEEGGKYFASKDGVLYEVNMDGVADILLYCPPAKTGDLLIPKEVRRVENAAFYQTLLSKIVFEDYSTEHENYGQPLLEVGVGALTNASINTSTATTYAVFSLKSSSAGKLTEISFPSHLKRLGAMACYKLDKQITVNFNQDAHLEAIEGAAFSYCQGITELKLPAVDSLGMSAFAFSKKLQTVTLGADSRIKSIPDCLFDNCVALTGFAVPASVTEIGERAFRFTSAMQTITFAEGSQLREIGNEAFRNSGLTSFTMPDSVETIGIKPFESTRNLETVTLSKNLMNVVSDSASIFYGCGALKAIHVPEDNHSFKSVDGVLYDAAETIIYCFPQAKDPTGFKLPDTLITIESHAFMRFAGETLALPESLETISAYAFYQSTLTSIHIPKNVISIGDEAFYGNSNTATLGEITFAPDSRLETIGAYAFMYTDIKNISLPDNVNTIGSYCFQGCDLLESIELPAALKVIENQTFKDCALLSQVVMQEGLTTIGNAAFSGKTDEDNMIAEVVIPSTVTSIGASAFAHQNHMKTVTFAEGSQLEILQDRAFFNCTALEGITLPASLKEIRASNSSFEFEGETYRMVRSRVFENCAAMKYVDMSACAEVLMIPGEMFIGCTGVETLLLPPNLETIHDFAFGSRKVDDGNVIYGLTSLKAITIPATVNSIGGYAFYGCQSLETVTFAEGSPITVLGTAEAVAGSLAGQYVFANTTALKTVVLPAELTTIGIGCFENSGVAQIDLPSTIQIIARKAFKNCDNIVDAGLSVNLQHVGDEAFYDCNSLEVADLTFGVDYLGTAAFAYCNKLKSVYIPATVTAISGNPFAGCTGVEKFELDPDSVDFVVVDNVLYDRSVYTLLYYPAFLSGENFQLPESVYEIGVGAFAGAQMKHFAVPERIHTIPESAFQASALETVTFHGGITSIGDYAFEGCANLNNVQMLNNITELGDYAFANCTGLTTFVFEEVDATGTPYRLGAHFFDGCTAMTEVILPNAYVNQTTIPDYMFANSGVVHAVIPEHVTDISNEGVFYGCKALESVTFERKVLDCDYPGRYYFAGCSKIKEITIPAGVYNPMGGNDSYAECTALEKLTAYVDGNVTPGGSDLSGCASFKEFVFWYVEFIEDDDGYYVDYTVEGPAHFGSLYEDAFRGIGGMKKMYLAGSTITFMGPAFAGSSIETVIIKSLGMLADSNGSPFSGSPNLKHVWFGVQGFPMIWSDAFTNMEYDVNFYFYTLTYDEVVERLGSDWMEEASEKAHFYFKDTIPADVEWPEEIKPAK